MDKIPPLQLGGSPPGHSIHETTFIGFRLGIVTNGLDMPPGDIVPGCRHERTPPHLQERRLRLVGVRSPTPPPPANIGRGRPVNAAVLDGTLRSVSHTLATTHPPPLPGCSPPGAHLVVLPLTTDPAVGRTFRGFHTSMPCSGCYTPTTGW